MLLLFLNSFKDSNLYKRVNFSSEVFTPHPLLTPPCALPPLPRVASLRAVRRRRRRRRTARRCALLT